MPSKKNKIPSKKNKMPSKRKSRFRRPPRFRRRGRKK